MPPVKPVLCLSLIFGFTIAYSVTAHPVRGSNKKDVTALETNKNISRLASQSNTSTSAIEKAKSLNNLAVNYAETGKLNEAIANWLEARSIFEKLNKTSEYIKVSISLSQAYIEKENYPLAINSLNLISNIAKQNQLKSLEAISISTLGNCYLEMGNLDRAIELYLDSLKIKEFSTTLINASIAYLNRSERFNNSVGITIKTEQIKEQTSDFKNAKFFAERAIILAENEGVTETIKAQINLLAFTKSPSMKKSVESINKLLESYPNTSYKALALTQLGQISSSINLLQKAIFFAEKIEDKNILSSAYFESAQIYLKEKKYERALEVNTKASKFAESVFDSKMLFLIFKQRGQIQEELGNNNTAIDAYLQALWNLKTTRGKINYNLLFKLQNKVNPFLRNYITLLLEENRGNEAIEVLSVLKLSEFQAYFNDPCLDVPVGAVELEQNNTIARIYSFITPAKTYILLRLPSGAIEIHKIDISSEKLTKTIDKYRRDLLDIYDRQSYKQSGQEVFELLIAPSSRELKENKISEIAFVHDGILKSVPMETLRSGDKYLLEEYQISYQTGLKLISSTTSENFSRSLLAGASEFLLSYQPLKKVNEEIKTVSKLVENPSLLLEGEFTKSNFFSILENREYSLVHVASHAIFQGNALNSYLVTYDGRININELADSFLSTKAPIYLLVLTACQTAEGSPNAPLGISGTAVRAKVRNIVASLWDLDDIQTFVFVEEFYTQLALNKSISAAKQEAQLSQKDEHPAYWGAFVFYNAGSN